MKRETREKKLRALLRKLAVSRKVAALLLDIWRDIDGAHADSNARLRAEVRRLREDLKRKNATVAAATRNMSSYALSCLFAEVDLVLKKKRKHK